MCLSIRARTPLMACVTRVSQSLLQEYLGQDLWGVDWGDRASANVAHACKPASEQQLRRRARAVPLVSPVGKLRRAAVTHLGKKDDVLRVFTRGTQPPPICERNVSV
jgi:hypothetical protein